MCASGGRGGGEKQDKLQTGGGRSVGRTREGWLRRRRSERCRHLADGRTDGRKREKEKQMVVKWRREMVSLQQPTRPTTVQPPPLRHAIPHSSFPRGRYEKGEGRGRGEAGRCLGRLISETGPRSTAAEDHLMYKTDRQTERQGDRRRFRHLFRFIAAVSSFPFSFSDTRANKEGRKERKHYKSN